MEELGNKWPKNPLRAVRRASDSPEAGVDYNRIVHALSVNKVIPVGRVMLTQQVHSRQIDDLVAAAAEYCFRHE
jgi:hypothetical protein